MKNIITIQHTQSIHHTNGMIGSWTDWDLSELGIQQAENIGRNLLNIFIRFIKSQAYSRDYRKTFRDYSNISYRIKRKKSWKMYWKICEMVKR